MHETNVNPCSGSSKSSHKRRFSTHTHELIEIWGSNANSILQTNFLPRFENNKQRRRGIIRYARYNSEMHQSPCKFFLWHESLNSPTKNLLDNWYSFKLFLRLKNGIIIRFNSRTELYRLKTTSVLFKSLPTKKNSW